MARAYSDDLRRLLIEAHQQKEGSLLVLAKRFHVSVGWAQEGVGDVSAQRQFGRGRRRAHAADCSKFTPEIRRQVGEWIDQQPDLSLHELQSRLLDELGLSSSIGRLWSLLRELGLRVKKSRSTPPSKIRRRSANGASGGASK